MRCGVQNHGASPKKIQPRAAQWLMKKRSCAAWHARDIIISHRAVPCWLVVKTQKGLFRQKKWSERKMWNVLHGSCRWICWSMIQRKQHSMDSMGIYRPILTGSVGYVPWCRGSWSTQICPKEVQVDWQSAPDLRIQEIPLQKSLLVNNYIC